MSATEAGCVVNLAWCVYACGGLGNYVELRDMAASAEAAARQRMQDLGRLLDEEATLDLIAASEAHLAGPDPVLQSLSFHV